MKLREVCPAEELDEARDEVGIDHLLNRRVLLLREQASEADSSEDDARVSLVENEKEKLLEVRDLHRDSL